MKIMKDSLLEKSFDLRTSKIFGGSITFEICETSTVNGNCTDTNSTTTHDNGDVDVCIVTDCPDK